MSISFKAIFRRYSKNNLTSEEYMGFLLSKSVMYLKRRFLGVIVNMSLWVLFYLRNPLASVVRIVYRISG